MTNRHRFIGSMTLSASILLCAGFSYWLTAETEAERVQKFQRKYELLLLQNREQEAGQLFLDVLAEGGDAPLDELWLPLVLMQKDGYGRLVNYTRILAGNPQREATYEEISNLVKNAPQNFQDEFKGYYFEELIGIVGVRVDLLKKYGLYQDN